MRYTEIERNDNDTFAGAETGVGSDADVMHSRVIAKSPVYYGWVILFAATFGMMMTTPGQTVGVAVFLDKIIEDLGVSRSLISALYSIGTLAGAFSLPFVGRFIDRRGPRLAVIVIASLFALACVWMGFVTGIITLVIGFTLIRALGQGSLGLVSMHVINIWFVRRRGMAVGIAGIGMAIATAAFPVLFELLIGVFEWRIAYMLLGLAIAVTILPIGALLFREQPERFGLQPDSGIASGSDPISEISYTLPEARRTITFWLFAIGGFLVAAFGTGLVFHHYSIMLENGLDRAVAATMFVAFGFVMAASNLTTGFLMDRVPPRFLLSFELAFLCAALLAAPNIGAPGLVLAYGVALGIMQGMSGAIQSSVYAHYFGRAHIGSIRGFTQTLLVSGTALGPLLFSLGLDAFGSYGPIFAICAVFPLVITVTAPWMKLKDGHRIK